MSKTKSETERVALLTSLGISAKGKSLGKGSSKPEAPHRSTREAEHDGIVLAPKGVDPHTMPVEDIVFDPALLAEYDDLSFKAQGNTASRKIFDLYKSLSRDRDRNGALQRRITSFITAERRSRLAGRPISEKIATTSEERDMAAMLATAKYTPQEVAEALRILDEKKEKPNA